MILDLRIEFGYENQSEYVEQPPDRNGFVHPPFIRKRRQRIWFDIPYLREPSWMSAQNAALYPELIAILDDCVAFMEDNVENEFYGRTYHGFKKYEIAKLKRDLAWIKSGKTELSKPELEKRKSLFWNYFNQIDIRRNVDFIETFPELSNWWNDCYETTNSQKE